MLLIIAVASSHGAVAEIEAIPLAVRTEIPAAALFTTVSPEASGIRAENRHVDRAMWGERYYEYVFGAVGSGVAIGDYDGDGWPDVFVVGKNTSCRLYRNRGDWKFDDVTAAAGVEDHGPAAMIWKQGASFADVNNDGRLDLYICRFDAPNLLYVNQGDGTFAERAREAGLDIKDGSVMAAFADFDRDGWLDVYLLTNVLSHRDNPDGQPDYLLHNRGDGRFENVSLRAGIYGKGRGHSVVWWDYNNDDWPDIYVANDFEPPDRLYRNNGNGTFTDVAANVLPHMPYFSMGSDLGDVNNDGLIDFFVADMAATSHAKDNRGMADTRAGAAARQSMVTEGLQFARNALFINTGTDQCLETAVMAGMQATDWTWSVRFEDLDEDGLQDLHVTNGMVRDYQDFDLAARVSNIQSVHGGIRAWEASPVLAERNLAYRNLGAMRFEETGVRWGLDHLGVSFGAAFADLDRDGDLDVVVNNFDAIATVSRNNSQRNHRVVISLRGTASNHFGVGTNLRIETDAGVQIRQLSLARGVLSTSEPIVHFGLGDCDRIRRLTVSWPAGGSQSFDDLAADHHYTITETAVPASAPIDPPRSRIFRGQFEEVSRATGLRFDLAEKPPRFPAEHPLLPFRHNRLGPGIAVGDVDGDAVDDVCVGGYASEPARFVSATRYGSFFPLGNLVFSDTPATPDGAPLLFDANGDGTNDLLLPQGGASRPTGDEAYRLRLYLNSGRGSFREAPPGALPPLALSAGPTAAVDFNRDGLLDVFVGGRVSPGQYPVAPRSVLLANAGGTFTDVTEMVAPGLARVGMVSAVLWTDVDDDTWPDLVLALQWGGIQCWRNVEGRRFEDWSSRLGFEAAGTGCWNSLAAADFNGDGIVDYVAGNLGLNTRYVATPERPVVLFHGNFYGSPSPVVIEAYYEADRLLPMRVRSELGEIMPALIDRFPLSGGFARGTIADVFLSKDLQSASRFPLTELQSGILLSEKKASLPAFRFQPLPRITQVAPVFGLAAGDFDGDGRADVYALQNTSSAHPESGPFNGGLSQLLRGDGRGNFAPVAPLDSQLIVSGDAKALVVLDLNRDGWPDFLLSRNNNTSLAFRNQGESGRRSVRVTLHGPPGNFTAVGARLTAELADGATQTSEVYAGSGYFSQSSPVCFFGATEVNPLQRIRVRWPSGATSTHTVPAQSRDLTISVPPL